MARSVEQIEREMVGLEQAVVAIAREFHAAYQTYLTALGPTVRQQLVLAAYHLCTQGYPDPFLALSVNQRQDFQQALLQLARKTQAELINLLHIPGTSPPRHDSTQDSMPTSSTEESISLEIVDLNVPPSAMDVGENVSAIEGSHGDESSPLAPGEFPAALPPKVLLRWQERLEQGVEETLQKASHGANRLLQKASIIPNKLPDPILEVATKAGAAAETTVGPPNLLNLIVETGVEDDETSSVTHIMAIRLRLSEIEFGDAQLTTGRSQLRNLNSRLSQLKREYQKKQREKTTAAAEAAWRSSWYEG